MNYHDQCPHCRSSDLAYEPSEFPEYQAFYTCRNCDFDFFVYQDGNAWLMVDKSL